MKLHFSFLGICICWISTFWVQFQSSVRLSKSACDSILMKEILAILLLVVKVILILQEVLDRGILFLGWEKNVSYIKTCTFCWGNTNEFFASFEQLLPKHFYIAFLWDIFFSNLRKTMQFLDRVLQRLPVSACSIFTYLFTIYSGEKKWWMEWRICLCTYTFQLF